MNYKKVMNVTRQIELGQKVRVASTLVERAVGLLATSSLAPGEGAWLTPCTSIHTFFMRFPIDVLFLDAGGVVVGQHSLVPWRISGVYRKSRGALELPAGTVRKTGTQIGDKIEMKDVG